jgi:DnaK suppressor protein
MMERMAKTLSKSEVQEFRRRLEAERQDTVRFLAELDQERRAVAADGPQDMGDICVSNLTRESLFERTSQKSRLLNRINTAIRRIDSGQFGTCSECGDPINRKRLEAMPWTTFCLGCQEELERAQPTPTMVTAELRD